MLVLPIRELWQPSWLHGSMRAYAQSRDKSWTDFLVHPSPWIRYPLDHLDRPDWYWNSNRVFKVNLWGPFWESMAELFEKLPCGREIHQGRLASVIVGGGKRRLFIIVSYFQQCILKPYHDWAMTVLRCIPNDGTFNQMAPLKYVKGGTDVSSYDFSSATDRFPSHPKCYFMWCPLCLGCFRNSSCWFIIESIWHRPAINQTKQLVKFLVNRYYLSWSLFSLTHHFVVGSS